MRPLAFELSSEAWKGVDFYTQKAGPVIHGWSRNLLKGDMMQDIEVGENALASYVALSIDDVAIKQGCVGWIDSKDRTCQRAPVTDAMLCKRHRNVALKREQAARIKQKEQADRTKAYRAENLPKWRAERELIEAQIDHY